jgi:hypothetical protein
VRKNAAASSVNSVGKARFTGTLLRPPVAKTAGVIAEVCFAGIS